MALCPNLKIVSNFGVGYDSVEVPALGIALLLAEIYRGTSLSSISGA